MRINQKQPHVLLYIGGIIFIMMIVILFVLSYYSGGKEEPKMRLSCGENELQTLYYGDRYHEMRTDIEKGFSRAIKENTWQDLPYVQIGDEIIIDLKNYDVDKYTVYDYILTKEGKIAYQEAVTLKYQVEVNREGQGVFKINANATRQIEEGEVVQGEIIRGFILRTVIDGSNFAFGFVVRTDSL